MRTCLQLIQRFFVGIFIKLHCGNEIIGSLNDDLLEALLIKPLKVADYMNIRRVIFLPYFDDGFYQRADVGSVAGQRDNVSGR